MSYERISLSLISACSALLGAAIGAWAVTWTERRKYKQIYRERILFGLEKGLEIIAHFIDYSHSAEKIELDRFLEHYRKAVEFQDKHPLLIRQAETIDKELYDCLKDLLSFRPEFSKPKGTIEEFKKVADQLDTKLEKCLQRIYEVWTE